MREFVTTSANQALQRTGSRLSLSFESQPRACRCARCEFLLMLRFDGVYANGAPFDQDNPDMSERTCLCFSDSGHVTAYLPFAGHHRTFRGIFRAEASRLSFIVASREGASIAFDGIINDNDLELRTVDEATGEGTIECYKFCPGTTKS
jgi:hypothetical protein